MYLIINIIKIMLLLARPASLRILGGWVMGSQDLMFEIGNVSKLRQYISAILKIRYIKHILKQAQWTLRQYFKMDTSLAFY